ncbi:CGNR zinc finger domain-containing protein [Rhizobiaceae bacterium n13]|uniref:CGNR zinc finger domain-containing protein n=1 Tax=Ferirhizobium litorale TaxID=2927786 RepID=A0AAE3QD77_9HYPH|nr:CGNR zinc finger domain-containing protein [Fererhizobium litorale]MDI7861069.1 CGNR zinc finger domain-containing protein [Fererhizobium litorale]MDI7921216.1 CGNR zinc finger domain-containing protein [Fererhizobium litorale]
MTFAWTPHRFAGGALALDVANSVILRSDPVRRTDRFAQPSQIDRFAAAAAELSAERTHFDGLAPVPAKDRPAFLALREAIDGYFRARVSGDATNDGLADLLEAIATILRHSGSNASLDTATARSALRLLSMPDPERLKICGNCGWLFLDRSKNRSRFWCDMAVCGNRAKASRHYRRKKDEAQT